MTINFYLFYFIFFYLQIDCDTDYGVELVKCLSAKFKFRVIAGFRDVDGIFARKLREAINANEDEVKIISLKVEDNNNLKNNMEKINTFLGENGNLWALVNLMCEISVGKVNWSTFDNQYKNVFQVNVINALILTRAALPLLRKSYGRVINVSDLPSRPARQFQSSWNMSTASLTFFSDCLRKEVFFFGIKVVTIEPDYYCTPFTKEDHLLPASQRSWDETDDSLKSKEDWFIVKNSIRDSFDCNNNVICQRIAESVGTALTIPSQCLEYKYVVGCTLNSSFLWFINVLVPEETQETVLSLYRNIVGLPQRS